MIVDFLERNDFRYERKFRVSTLSYLEIETLIKMHPKHFSEVYFKRTINNIYFDSLSMQDYNEAVNGNSDRKKVRIRWYGDMFGNISSPVLEFKIKQSHMGTKVSFPLKPFIFDKGLDLGSLNDSLKHSDLPSAVSSHLLDLRPAIANQYKRRYFISYDKKFRITVDTAIKYRSFTSGNEFQERNAVIVELKYDQKFDDEASDVSSLFPFRVTKNSKYQNGVEYLALA